MKSVVLICNNNNNNDNNNNNNNYYYSYNYNNNNDAFLKRFFSETQKCYLEISTNPRWKQNLKV